jgi:membrane associated rhomboid family serine protease
VFPISDVIPSRTRPVVTVAIIIVNALIFLYQLTLPEPALQLFVGAYAVVPSHFHPATLITSQFLHGGVLHVGGNMLYLWIVGDNVEDRLGHVRFLVFYLFAGIAAAMLQILFNPFSTVPMIGASGAIAGVMGAYFVLYPHSRVLTVVFLLFILDVVEIPAIFFLGVWFVMQLLNGVGSIGVSMGGGTAFWAHVGGFVVGFLAGVGLRRRDRRWHE